MTISTPHTNTSRFFQAFTAAIGWNALFYSLYKICFVALTFVLYRKLPSSYFSQWATANSFIFLLLLWLNCGFKKSIPRFAPVFSKNNAFHKKFIGLLILFKIIVLLFGIPLLTTLLDWFTPHLLFLPLVIGIFVTEGICSLLLLIYHAHFWQKQFNLIQALFLLLEMFLNFSYLFFFKANPTTIVSFLFITKLLGNIGTFIFSIMLLPALYKNTRTISHEIVDAPKILRDFVKHSVYMWFTVILQSLSERNFLFPFITFVQGPLIANMFKVIHDAAIFFQRIAVQTIGVADTALLSYVEVIDTRVSELRIAFTSIFKTVFLLCIPLLCLGIFLFFKNHATTIPTSSLILFLIVSSGSALEIILSPYARVLEVKLRYREIFWSYAPYTCGYAFLLTLYASSTISLLCFIAATHSIRMVSSLSMVYFAKKDFQVPFPSLFTGVVLGLCFLLSLGGWFFFF
jgi:hypothetical protein